MMIADIQYEMRAAWRQIHARFGASARRFWVKECCGVHPSPLVRVQVCGPR